MKILSPVALGDLQLANRVVMAPLTRMRSGEAGVPDDLVAAYYAQRASTGLIVTEGTYPTQESRSYPGQPGIVTDEQQAGWAQVAEAVHAGGGRLFMQVMHGGRVSHPAINGAERVVAPSAVAVQGEAHTPQGKLPYPVPHALTADELVQTRDAFVAAARRAVDEDGGDARLHLGLQVAVVVAGGDHDEAVHPPGTEREDELLLVLRVLGAGTVDQQCAVRAGHFLHGAAQRAVEGVGEVLQHEADGRGPALAQDARAVVAAEPESLDGLLHAALGVRGDTGLAVHHA